MIPNLEGRRGEARDECWQQGALCLVWICVSMGGDFPPLHCSYEPLPAVLCSALGLQHEENMELLE